MSQYQVMQLTQLSDKLKVYKYCSILPKYFSILVFHYFINLLKPLFILI